MFSEIPCRALSKYPPAKPGIALALDCTTDVLVFDPDERPIVDDLRRQFEAVSKLPEEERAIARHLL